MILGDGISTEAKAGSHGYDRDDVADFEALAECHRILRKGGVWFGIDCFKVGNGPWLVASLAHILKYIRIRFQFLL